MVKKILKTVACLMLMVSMSGCFKRGSGAKAPMIKCPNVITVTQGETFRYREACRVEGTSSANKINTEIIGVQTLRIVSENKGSISVRETKVAVIPEKVVPVEETPEPTVLPKPKPKPTPTPEPVETAKPEETAPAATPAPTPTPTPAPAQTLVAAAPVVEPQPTPEPQPVVPDIGHGSEEIWGEDPWDAMHACKAKLDTMPYGRCDPDSEENPTHYILSW